MQTALDDSMAKIAQAGGSEGLVAHIAQEFWTVNLTSTFVHDLLFD